MPKPVPLADRWALITGASSGLGSEFARQLAARGMHLILVARREPPMRELADDLHRRHGTRVEVFAKDLSVSAQVLELVAQVRGLDVPLEVVVNNAGFGIVGEVPDTDPDRVQEMIRLNVAALTELTYRFLPGFMERGHGAIVNLASLAAFQPLAYMGAYAASKAYVLHLSEALNAESSERGVTVLAVCPGITKTDFFNVAGVPGWLKKFSSMSPEQVVRRAIRSLERRHQYVVPGWRNYWVSLLARSWSRHRVVMTTKRFFRPKPRPSK